MIDVNWGSYNQIMAGRIHEEKRCGNCDHWMKSVQCPKESLPRNLRPSDCDFVCEKFLQRI